MDRRKINATGCRQDQQGFVLLTALAFMIVLTVIVLSTVNVSSSDEKIARNSRDKDIAFAAAEAAMRDAEMYISGTFRYPNWPANLDPATHTSGTIVQYFNLACTNALCDVRLIPLAVPIDQLDLINGDARDAGIANNSVPIGGPGGNTTGSPHIYGVNAQPHYLIEVVDDQSTNPKNFVFRITAQGEGLSANTRVTLQEFYSTN
jgi:type IV pilus assembly protein PilX